MTEETAVKNGTRFEHRGVTIWDAPASKEFSNFKVLVVQVGEVNPNFGYFQTYTEKTGRERALRKLFEHMGRGY